MGKSIKLISLILLITLFFSKITGCLNTTNEIIDEYPIFTSYRDIPGVTQYEVDKIEEIRRKVDYFSFGMVLSTEAFYDTYGQINGYSAFFTEWLTQLFGIPFIPELHSFSDMYSGLDNKEIDFTGYLMATDERREIFYMTSPITQRSFSYFRLTGSEPIPEIRKTRLPRYALVKGTATTHSIMTSAIHDFIPVFIDDHIEVYDLLINNEADAFVSINSSEAWFDEFYDIEAVDFFPLIFSTASFATGNRDLRVFISVVQKALDAGILQYLNTLYELGEREYRRNKLQLRLT